MAHNITVTHTVYGKEDGAYVVREEWTETIAVDDLPSDTWLSETHQVSYEWAGTSVPL